MRNLIIRHLEVNDLEQLKELYKQFWNENSDIDRMKIKFKEIRDNPKYILLSALHEGKLVGSIMGIVCDELYGTCCPFLIMEDLVVDKKYRRMGIGKALIAELEKRAKEWNCSQILFITEAERKGAISFYENLGYNSKTHIGFKKPL